MPINIKPKHDCVLHVIDFTIAVYFSIHPVSPEIIKELYSLNEDANIDVSEVPSIALSFTSLKNVAEFEKDKLNQYAYYIEFTPIYDSEELACAIKETLEKEHNLKVNIIYDDFSQEDDIKVTSPI